MDDYIHNVILWLLGVLYGVCLSLSFAFSNAIPLLIGANITFIIILVDYINRRNK